MLDAGDALADLLDLSRADITSYRPEKVSRAVARIDELEARCRWLREEAERVPLKSPLDGNDLMALFGREPGPWLRPVKDHLLSLVIDGQLAPDDRATAEAVARAFVAASEHASPLPVRDEPSSVPEAQGRDQPQSSTEKRAARASNRRQSRQAGEALRQRPGSETTQLNVPRNG
jgi:poly(A) polymerase